MLAVALLSIEQGEFNVVGFFKRKLADNKALAEKRGLVLIPMQVYTAGSVSYRSWGSSLNGFYSDVRNINQSVMKLFLTLILTFLLFSVKAQTSVYHPFPDSAATWNIHYKQFCFMNGTSDQNYSITMAGDTVINSQVYHKLTTPYVQIYTSGCGTMGTGYKGAIRQDKINRKVFFVPPSGSAEQLLYDFTMQVGDTVKGYAETIAPPRDRVISIDSVLVGSTYRKRWKVNSNYNIYFIEGVGSTYGLIMKSPGNLLDGSGDLTITCFQQNGKTVYPDTVTSCKLITTSVNTTEGNPNEINIFPNPSNDSFTIDLRQALSVNAIYIKDILGNTVFHRQLSSGSYIHVDHLKSGVYFLMTSSNDMVLPGVRKIIIR